MYLFLTILFVLKLIFKILYLVSLSLSLSCLGSFSQSSGDGETRAAFGNVASHGRSNSFSLCRWGDCQINQTAKGLGQLPGTAVNFSIWCGSAGLDPAQHNSKRDLSTLVHDLLFYTCLRSIHVT